MPLYLASRNYIYETIFLTLQILAFAKRKMTSSWWLLTVFTIFHVLVSFSCHPKSFFIPISALSLKRRNYFQVINRRRNTSAAPSLWNINFGQIIQSEVNEFKLCSKFYFLNGPFPASFSLFSSFQYSWQ